MNHPHFFKAYSRLGLIHVPNHGTEKNIGVEHGPDAVLSSSFLKNFSDDTQVTSFHFTNPDTITSSDYKKTIAHDQHVFAQTIQHNLRPTETQVVVGGDHSVVFGSLVALLSRVDPKNLGYIQFDSHGDIHTFTTSPSGNFHGMYFRPFIGDFDDAQIVSLVPAQIPTPNILYIGNLDLEPEELEFMTTHNVQKLSRDEIQKDSDAIHARIKTFSQKFSHLHISFDIDVFDQSLVSATGTPSSDGFFLEDIFPMLEILATHPSLSIDLVEVNPEKKGAEKTVTIAQKILLTLISP